LDANLGTGFDKIGFTLPQPVGVVVAITPFNYPSLLVLHKVGPALAAGNAVVLKPALAAPLTAIALAQCFLDAGLPPGVLGVFSMAPAARLGTQLVADPRVNKVSFTGSTRVGEMITKIAGIKKLSLELGASSPVIVTKHADLEQAAHSIALGGYVNAGQVCIAAQRIIVEESIREDFLAVFDSEGGGHHAW
jgi:acyl-CoA reductase-like NAD-dependent aldehyde dehydrogenase